MDAEKQEEIIAFVLRSILASASHKVVLFL